MSTDPQDNVGQGFTISIIPHQPSDTHITLYIEIRLASLRLNPESFSPFYMRELTFSRLQWKERLSHPGVTTLYIADPEPIANDGDDKGSLIKSLAGSKHNSKPWIGTLTILSPAFLTSTIGIADTPKAVNLFNTGEVELWHLSGMWVRPEWRRKGVGKVLIQRALEVVKSSQSKYALGGQGYS